MPLLLAVLQLYLYYLLTSKIAVILAVHTKCYHDYNLSAVNQQYSNSEYIFSVVEEMYILAVYNQ